MDSPTRHLWGHGINVRFTKYDGNFSASTHERCLTTSTNHNLPNRIIGTIIPDYDNNPTNSPQWSYAYNDACPLAAPVSSYAYASDGRLTSQTDPLGRVTAYAYDCRDQLTQVQYADGDSNPNNNPVASYS